AFFYEKLDIDGLTQKDAYLKNISPFKKMLSNRFSSYEFKIGFSEEIEQLKKLLRKSQIILTTNYDTLMEDLYNSTNEDKIKTYIGQNGFFRPTYGYAELYKVHGCVNEPHTLTITNTDYNHFDENSVLISAKLISMLLHSPIIFLGYSLTDRNIRKIIKDFAGSLGEEEVSQLEKRLIIVEWKQGEQELKEEVVVDKELGCSFTVIKTDNYLRLFEKISSINQGVSPAEIRRYQHVIKSIIEQRGKEGTLKNVLVSPEQLDNVNEVVENKNIVVAVGDSKTIFKMPTTLDYIYDYILEDVEQNSDIILRFIASQNKKTILPLLRYANEENIESSNLHHKEKRKIKERLKKQAHLRVQLDVLNYKKDYTSLDEILAEKFPIAREYSTVAFNIERIGLENTKKYLIDEIDKVRESGENTIHTGLRRIALIYDLHKNG
ncbi:MAG: SIR2 family protein, partial [Romboutsia sp.]|uniref:SIR2 family protein n=1 Tax=Romboutsia sp. TaxID=1965302 RepID=UPI003F39119A